MEATFSTKTVNKQAGNALPPRAGTGKGPHNPPKVRPRRDLDRNSTKRPTHPNFLTPPFMSNFAETFMNALQQAEQSRNPDGLAALFGEDAELLNLALTEPLRGTEGARRFWSHYLQAFEKIHSQFHQVTQTEDTAVLEWLSEGVMAATGQPFNYRGVSVVEHDGEKVRRFRSYYDSAVFLPGGAKHKETM
jgi:ketosteroid isomerase-like protein